MPIGDYLKITSISINSALNQTLIYSNFIFVLDTKTDKEAKRIEKDLKNIERSIIIRTNRVGQGMARQIGVDAAESEFIAFLDYDDIWHPKKIELQIKQLRKEEADFSFCSYRAVNINRKKILFNVHCKRKISLINFFICCPIGVSTVLCKRKIFSDLMKLSHAKKRWDYITWFKLWRDFKPLHAICSDYLALIIKREKSISSNYWTSTAGYTSMQKAFKKLGYNTIISYVIALLYSLFQLPVKAKRIFFKFYLKDSKNIKDLDIKYYLSN